MDLIKYQALIGKRVWLLQGVSESPAHYGEIAAVYNGFLGGEVDVSIRLQDGSLTIVGASQKGRAWDVISQ
jgi:hypothetical protein